MKREDKIGYLISIALSVLIISVVIWGIMTQNWGYEEEVTEIWLPENYQIVNKKDNIYTSISQVQPSGTAVYLPFEEYKRLFNEATVAITERGHIYYWTEKENVTYVTSYQLSRKWAIPSEIEILSDKSIKLINYEGQDLIAILGIVFGLIIAVVGGLLISAGIRRWKEKKDP